MFELAALLCAGALFIAALALLVYVAYRFLSLAISLDSFILRELQSRPQVVSSPAADTSGSILQSQLKEFIANRLKPTDGAFEFNTDEELFLNETIQNLRAQGIKEEELDAFMKHAVTVKEE